MRALVLRRIMDLLAELHGRMPRPARIEKHATAERDHVGLSVGDNVLGLLCLSDKADGHRRNTGLAADSLRERHLIARSDLQLLLRHRAAARRGNVITAAFLEFRDRKS